MKVNSHTFPVTGHFASIQQDPFYTPEPGRYPGEPENSPPIPPHRHKPRNPTTVKTPPLHRERVKLSQILSTTASSFSPLLFSQKRVLLKYLAISWYIFFYTMDSILSGNHERVPKARAKEDSRWSKGGGLFSLNYVSYQLPLIGKSGLEKLLVYLSLISWHKLIRTPTSLSFWVAKSHHLGTFLINCLYRSLTLDGNGPITLELQTRTD